MAYLDPNIPLRMPQQPTFAEQAGQAFQLADVVEKQKAMQQQKQDSANLQQYLKEGGNLDTPEGIAKAAEWGRQNLSPSGYKTIVSAGQEMRTNEQKRIEALSKAEGAQLDNMIKRGEVIGQSVAPVLSKYAERKAEVGEQQATEEFKTDLQPVLQSMVQQRLITPQQAQQYADASPAQVESVLQSTNYGRKMVLEAAKLKQIQAGTEADIALKAEREARTAEIKKGRPARAAVGGGAGGGAGVMTDDSLQSGIAMLRAGMSKKDIIAGYGKESGKRWDQIQTATIKQIMDENPGMSRRDAARQLSLGQTEYKSDVTAITALKKDLAAIAPFERMLKSNGQIAIDLSKKLIQSNSAFANKSLNWLKQNVGDNPDTAEFLAQNHFVQTEAARVLNNPRLVGQLTDTAKREMQDIVRGEAPLNSYERVIRRIQNDGERRVAEMGKQLDILQTPPGEKRKAAEETAQRAAASPANMGAAPAPKTAPQGAIDLLKQNPQFKEQFRKKYGYVPEGM